MAVVKKKLNFLNYKPFFRKNFKPKIKSKKKFINFSVTRLRKIYKESSLDSIKLTPLIRKYLNPIVKTNDEIYWVSNHFFGSAGGLKPLKVSNYNNEKLLEDISLKLKVLNKFRGSLVKNGKFEKAHNIFLTLLFKLSNELSKPGSLVLFQAMNKIKPYVRLEVRRIGGAKYSVPRPLTELGRFSVAIKWLLKKALASKGMPVVEALKIEVLKIHRGDSDLIKMCSDVHSTAINNRMFVLRGKRTKFNVMRSISQRKRFNNFRVK